MSLQNLQVVGYQEGQPILQRQRQDLAPILRYEGARRSRRCGGEGREMGALQRESQLFLA